jgi:hypothetical protein
MRQIQSQNRVARLQHCRKRCRIRLRAGVRLHVHVLAAKDLFGAVARQVLHHVRVFAATVVAASGIPLRILVGKNRAGSFQHRF